MGRGPGLAGVMPRWMSGCRKGRYTLESTLGRGALYLGSVLYLPAALRGPHMPTCLAGDLSAPSCAPSCMVVNVRLVQC